MTAAVTAIAVTMVTRRRLALVHIEEGNFAEALRQYDVYRKLLRVELGLPPSPRFRRLIGPLLGRPLDGLAPLPGQGPGGKVLFQRA